MGMPESLLLLAPVLGVVALFGHLARSRIRVMRYHDLPTPRINEMSHGGGGSG